MNTRHFRSHDRSEDARSRPKRSMHKLLDYEIVDYDFQKDFYSHTALLKQLVYAAFFFFIISACSLVDTRPSSLFQTLGQCVARRKGACVKKKRGGLSLACFFTPTIREPGTGDIRACSVCSAFG